jgi:hypothetical protein
MNLQEFRVMMASFRDQATEEAKTLKDSYLVLERLQSLYRSLGTEHQALADQVIAEWALSDDDGTRFDAIAMIREFRILTAIPALETLVQRLESSTLPGAPYEAEKAMHVIIALGDRRTD